MSDAQDYRWTARLPALIAGLLALLLGSALLRRHWPWAVGLGITGAGLLFYSYLLTDWCAAPLGGLTWGRMTWPHHSLMDCVELVRW